MKKTGRFRSLQAKMTISSTALFLIAVLLMEFCVYAVASRMQLRDAIRQNSELMLTMGRSFDDSVTNFKQQINHITMNQELQAELKRRPQSEVEELARCDKLRSQVVTRTLAMDTVEGVYLYGPDGALLTFWQKKYRAGDAFVVFPTQAGQLAENGAITPEMRDGRLTFSRLIRDMATLEPLGSITVLYDAQALQKVVATITPNDNRFVAVFDDEGGVVAHNSGRTATLRTVMEQTDLTAVPSDTLVQLEGIGPALVSRYESRTPGWSVVCVVERGQLLRSQNFTLRMLLVIGALGLVLGAAVQALLARRITRPLHQMVALARRVEEDDYSVRAQVHTGDEVEQLADSFNHMIGRIDVLVNQNLRAQLRYRDMQLAALQAQIDPHFLYNTLECINCLAQLDRKDDVRRVTIAFSRIMQSLAKGPQWVTLREELAYTKDFLTIYQVLLGEKLDSALEVDKACADVRIPRLTVQPLVENAVLHGIKPACGPGHVTVTVSPARQGTLVSISDDGVGMPPALAQAVRAYAAAGEAPPQAPSIGLGLRSVIDRLRLCYGPRAQLSLQSSVEWGTTIDLLLPGEGPGGAGEEAPPWDAPL